MHGELTIFHLEHAQGPEPRETSFVNDSIFVAHWKTCLRHIGFGIASEENVSSPSALIGKEAYQFCLEVICGLHSPLLGETEVFGQFKDFVLDYKQNGTSANLKKIFDALIEDAKKVRQKHLTNLGSQSYGSLVRRYLKEEKAVCILGSGRLAKDIVPWLKNKEKVEIVARTPEKALSWSEYFKNVSVLSLKDQGASSAPFVVAAPMSAEEIRGWMDSSRTQSSLVIDLRESSQTDPLVLKNVKVIPLVEFFNEIKGVQSQLANIVGQAQQWIKDISVQRHQSAAVRPFGWDDLCA
ncbi:MAG: hypothetical protein AB7F59_02160 [Bdellovibrionales bacterium]